MRISPVAFSTGIGLLIFMSERFGLTSHCCFLRPFHDLCLLLKFSWKLLIVSWSAPPVDW